MKRKFILPLVLGTTAVVVAVLAVPLRRATATNSPIAQLSRSEPDRTFPARLSIETPYRPCVRDATREGDLIPRESCGAPAKARVNVYDLESGGESFHPDSLQAAALATVIWKGEKEGALNAAIARLERAERLTTDPLPILVDLSAVYLARAERTQNPRDVAAALDYAEQAVKLDPSNRKALYNRALARQAQGLDEAAAEAWEAYLAADPRSRWAEEARRRKADLFRGTIAPVMPQPRARPADLAAFVREFPQEARVHGLETVLDAWGRAFLAGDVAGAALQLSFAEGLGLELEKRPAGDASLAECVRAIRAVAEDREATAALARAHRAYGAGQRHLVALELKDALDSANALLRHRPRSPVLLQWGLLLRGRTMVVDGQRDSARVLLRRQILEVDSVRYPALAGHARSTLATVRLRDPAFEDARALALQAERHLIRASEPEFAAAARSTAGEAACRQGDSVQAYRLMHNAQMVLRRYRSSRLLHTHLHGFANCAHDVMPFAALVLLDEDVRVAKRVRVHDRGGRLLDALQGRARVRTIVGDPAGAEADLDSASPLVTYFPDRVVREWAQAALEVARVRSDSNANLDSAVAAMTNLNVLWMFPALIRRADVKLAKGDLEGATTDLEAVVTRIRALSRQQSDPALRQAMVEQARDRFDRLVMLYLQLDRPEDALRALERGRVSFSASGDDQSGGEIRLSAPAREVALEYALIADTLLTWVIRGDVIHLARQPIDRDQFLLAVEQVRAAMESSSREAAATPALRRLYDVLVAPVRGRLGPRDTSLVILADGEVAGVPFEALIDAEGRHLVESYTLRFAPTLADASRSRPAGETGGRALLVADPDFDQMRHPLLGRLAGTRVEVDSLERFFSGAVRLEDETATREAFRRHAQAASLIHYAGHAVFDDARPDRSYLLLAGQDTTGRLTAEAIREMDLGGVRLVVLSACRTHRARGGRSGGFAGLSGALLAAGAGGVVGSLWQVNDGLAEPLMTAFHREYKKSGHPAAALRQAQLTMLQSGSPLAAWAGFRYAGN